jgi:hypothetical protein
MTTGTQQLDTLGIAADCFTDTGALSRSTQSHQYAIEPIYFACPHRLLPMLPKHLIAEQHDAFREESPRKHNNATRRFP